MIDLPLIAAGDDFSGWFQLLTIVLIGLFALVNALIKKFAERNRRKAAGEAPEDGEGKSALQSIGDEISMEIKKYIGEIKEAPAAEGPPAPVSPTPVPPPIPPPPPVVRAPRPLTRSEPLDEIPPPKRRRKRARPAPVATPKKVSPLHTREGLRQAIISHEILGPPVSLRRGRRSSSRLTRR